MYSMLCEDYLLEIFCKFRYRKDKEEKDFDLAKIDLNEVELLEKILHYYKPRFLPTEKQVWFYKIAKDKEPKPYSSMLRGLNLLPEKDALDLTKFKVILSTSRSDFPFVNVNGDRLENNFTASFASGESRDKALAHFKALLAKATKVEVYDNFLNDSGKNGGKNWQHFLDVMRQILPQNSNLQMDIFTQNYQNTKKCETDLKKINANLIVNFYSYNTNNTHDRYLIIDNKMEIILTSGFFHLVNPANTGNNIKDFTYVLKEK